MMVCILVSVLMFCNFLISDFLKLLLFNPVFMDENVRKITLNQIKDHALDIGNIEKQFIIITPNNLSGIRTSDKVHIHRMRAPMRELATGPRQTTIEFTGV